MVNLRKNDRPGSAWFPKAGLGLFIHWGISAVDGYLDLSWGMMKNFKYTFDRKAGPMRLDALYYALTYSIMLSSLVASDLIFLGGLLGKVTVRLGGFSTGLWGMAILVFIASMMLTLSLERNEFNLESLALVALMLFTYAKLWVFVVVKAMWDLLMDALLKREVKWDKTVRYVETD